MILAYTTGRRVFTGAMLAAASAVLALPAAAQTLPHAPKLGNPPEALNMRLVGHNDLQGRSAYQPTISKQGGRYIAYIGHHGANPGPTNPMTGQSELNGTSIVDVTDPKAPKYLAHIPACVTAARSARAIPTRSTCCARSDARVTRFGT
jgi:hypothetical protein